jgi:hypothetical protein
MPFRQTVLSYATLLQQFEKLPQLYSARNMQGNAAHGSICHPYAEWTHKMNNAYIYCALNKARSPFPVRFIIPTPTLALGEAFRVRQSISISITKILSIYNFCGILSLKYLFNSREIRCWLLFMFEAKIPGTHIPEFWDSLGGIHSSILLLNWDTMMVNSLDLFPKFPVTHNEFKDVFFNYTGLSYFIPTHDSNMQTSVFITKTHTPFTPIQQSLIDELKMIQVTPAEVHSDSYKEYKQYKFIPLNNNDLPYSPISLHDTIRDNTISTPSISQLKPTWLQSTQRGGSLITTNKTYKLQKSTKLDLFTNLCMSDNGMRYYTTFINTICIILQKINVLTSDGKYSNNWTSIEMNELTSYINTIYPHICISYASFAKLHVKYINKFLVYKPISYAYFPYYELITKYKILDQYLNYGAASNIAVFSYNLSQLELFTKFNLRPDFYIISDTHKDLRDMQSQYTEIYKVMSSYGATNKLTFTNNKTIYELLTTTTQLYQLLIFNAFILDGPSFGIIHSFPNIFNSCIGMVLGLTNVTMGGTFILYIETLAYKEQADIYLILKRYYRTVDIFVPEMYLQFKRGGVHLVCRNFLGIPPPELSDIHEILTQMQRHWPNDMNDFKVGDPLCAVNYLFMLNIPVALITTFADF